MNSLPLSWTFSNHKSSYQRIINSRKIKWYALQNTNIEEFKSEFNSNNQLEKRTIIRGCSSEIKKFLESEGYSSFHAGKEAILFTNRDHFEKRSLRNQLKRGLRNGKIVQLSYSPENKRKLDEFRKRCIHGKYPQLKNLFEVNFTKKHFLNVFLNTNNEWLGAVMISQNTPEKLHTELLLRSEETPNGVMEALIEYSFKFARNNGYTILSLGEVPFLWENEKESGFYSLLLKKSAKYFRFAYDYKGLFAFKDKFNPEWKNVYICSNNKLGIKELYFLLINTNIHNLIITKFFRKLVADKIKALFQNNRIFVPRKLDFNKT